MNGWKFSLTDVRGHNWKLTKNGGEGVYLAPGAVSDLVASWVRPTVSTAGVDGVRVRRDEVHLEPISGSLKCIAHDIDWRDADESFAEFTRMWDVVQPCYLRALNPSGAQLVLPVTLAGAVAAPPENIGSPLFHFQIPVIADSGAWQEVHAATATGGALDVQVHAGAVANMVYPRVRWSQACQLTLPSGVTIELPTVDDWRTIDLDPSTAYTVTTSEGELDRDLRNRLWPKMKSEGVPRHTARSYRITNGATLSWDISVASPWR